MEAELAHPASRKHRGRRFFTSDLPLSAGGGEKISKAQSFAKRHDKDEVTFGVGNLEPGVDPLAGFDPLDNQFFGGFQGFGFGGSEVREDHSLLVPVESSRRLVGNVKVKTRHKKPRGVRI